MASNSTSSPGFAFGSYQWICNQAPLIVCPLLGDTGYGIEPICYARNVDINGTIIFQPATAFLHICAIGMVAVMLFHIRAKYTAVGRLEITHFFYMYLAQEFLAIFLDSGLIPSSSDVYDWFAAIHTGITCATFWCLLVNGFVGFQFAEDGTPLSLWSLRISSLFIFVVTGFFAIATFKSLSTFSAATPVALWIFMFIFNLACLFIYVIMQLVLVIRTLDDRWPIGDIIFGVMFFVAGQVILYGFSVTICDSLTHYIDGLFFSSLCTLLAVMMVYKYWDSITKEDLEFSVGSKQAAWEIDYSSIQDNKGFDAGYGGFAGGTSGPGYAGGYGNQAYPPPPPPPKDYAY